MADYFLGTASDAAQAQLQQLQQYARQLQLQVQVFDASVPDKRMLFFAFDGTGNNKDNPAFGPATNVAHLYDVAKQLWLQRSGNDLQMTLLETNDKLIVQNWYSSTSYQVDRFSLSDGKVLLAAQVDTLVNAMAGFAPPIGQSSLPAAYQTTLDPLLTATWR